MNQQDVIDRLVSESFDIGLHGNVKIVGMKAIEGDLVKPDLLEKGFSGTKKHSIKSDDLFFMVFVIAGGCHQLGLFMVTV